VSDAVLVDITDGVADVRLNRPEAMNALNDDLFAALIDTGQLLRSEPGLRAVVLSGEGRGFCAGLDTSSFAGQTSGARLVPADVDGDPDRSGDLGVDGLRGQAAAVPIDPANLLAERAAMRETTGSPNQLEAVRARIERRSPRFED
jgi:Enoyl-CoA hydratase/isomerase